MTTLPASTQPTNTPSQSPSSVGPLRYARPSARKRLSSILAWVAIGILLVVVCYPLLWLLLNSFKSQREFIEEPFWSFPSTVNFDNYVEAWNTGNLGQYLQNSAIAVIPALAILILLGVGAAFALEVLVWRGRGPVLLLFLAGIMVPVQAILLPLFTAYYKLHLTGTLWPLTITYITSGLPLTVYMMATYFRAVPREIFEAAAIDGASVLRSFWSIGVPLVRNAVFTVSLVQFFFMWNDLLVAITFTNSDELRTVQVGLLNFSGQFGATQYGPLFAAICINVFGILVIYAVLNRQIMTGLAGGAVKG